MESNALRESNSTPLRHALSLLVLLGLAVAARIRITMLDFNSLLTTYLEDDAFYYYKIAANIFNLHRITYDGEQLSNGFHPLWLILITAFYTPANDGVDFVYRVQWIMLFCALLTVVALYFTLMRLRAGWICSAMITAVFCVHSTFVDMQTTGLETSLNTLILLMLFNAFLTIFLQPLSSIQRYVYFGFVAAAAFLTRTDNGITLLLLFAALAWKFRQNLAQCLPRLFLSGVIALLLALPWLLWNQINFGGLIQGSGKIETIYWGEPRFSWAHTAYNFLNAPLRVYQDMKVFSEIFVYPSGNMELLTALFLFAWAIVILLLLFDRCTTSSLRALAIFCVAVFSVFIYHTGFRNFVRMWYYMPVGLVVFLSMAGLVVIGNGYQRPRAISYAAVLLVLLWLVSVLWIYSPAKLPGVADQPSSHTVVAKWIGENTPPDATIGSMNSGILSYLAPRKVVNLDGVVDQRTMQALWKRTHLAYVHERGIGYLVDNDGALAIYCAENPFHTCQQVFIFGDSHNPGKVMKVIDKK